MSDITTTITLTLTHSRKLTEEELDNLVGNLTDHIANERSAATEGFSEITEVRVAGDYSVDGKIERSFLPNVRKAA